MVGSLVIMGGSRSLRFLLLQWIIAFSLLKVVCCSYFFVTPMDGSLVIMEGSSEERCVGLECRSAWSPWQVDS